MNLIKFIGNTLTAEISVWPDHTLTFTLNWVGKLCCFPCLAEQILGTPPGPCSPDDVFNFPIPGKAGAIMAMLRDMDNQICATCRKRVDMLAFVFNTLPNCTHCVQEKVELSNELAND